jgi:hypothetical protein
MATISRLLAVLLLAAWITGSLQAQVRPAAAPHEAPAGCHEHGPTAPAPEPVSYACCQAGHQSAILQEPSTSRPAFLHVSRVAEFTAAVIQVAMLNGFGNPLILYGDPPSWAPLRI